jgi:hypothetical protein
MPDKTGLLRLLIKVQTTIALLSRFTDASTPIHTGRDRSASAGVAPGMTQASHLLMSIKVLSVLTNRFSIMRR